MSGHRRRYRRRSRHNRSRRRRYGRSGFARIGQHKFNAVANGRIILELDAFLLSDTVAVAQRGKEFGLFDRINTQVGFHIQVNVQHIFRITGFVADHFDYFFGHGRFVQRYGRSFRSNRRRRSYRRLYSRRYRRLRHRGRRRRYGRSGFSCIGQYKFNAVANGRIIFELDAFLLSDTVAVAQRGKEFGLFDRINTEVGFHIQVNIQHIFRITRLFADHFDHFFGHGRFVQGYGFRGRSNGRSRGSRRLSGRGFVRVDDVYFIHKRLRAFHHQGRFDTVLVVIFDAQRVLHHFQHRGLLAGNLLQPSLMSGFVGDAGFAFLPHFFQ